MAIRLSVVPLGRVEARLLRGLAEALADAGFEASVHDERALPAEAFDAARGQWRAEPLLAVLAHEPGPRVLGVTEHDLYAGGLSFVFGISPCPGRASLISLARLGLGGEESLLLERARKEAVHELGHASGLRHCADPRCVMHFSNSLSDTDRKHARPCRRCAELLGRAGVARAPLASRTDGAGSERRILHVDMDAFFANAERLRRPELAGRPIVVGGRGDPTQRGVVSSASYEARAYGIRSGMPLRTAFRHCPSAVFLPVDFAWYRELSERFKAALREFADVIEDAGIDEAFADLTRVEGGSEDLARAIQVRIRERTGLSCSIGIAANKLLAKMASDLDKPEGLTVLGKGDLEARIWPLPTRALPGVGPKTESRLRELGASRVGELAELPLDVLTDAFGPARGAHLHRAARGIDESPLVPHQEPRSVGREITFEQDVDDPSAVARALGELLGDACARLRRDGFAGRVVGVKLRFADFETHSHAETLPAATDDPAALREAAFRCLGRFAIEKKVRLVGVRISGLEPVESLPSAAGEPAQLLVTARGFGTVREARRALREALPGARIRGTGFAGILCVEASGDPLALAERAAAAAAAGRIGRVMAVLAEVESARPPIEQAAVALGQRHVGPGESFCFRLHKRGPHALAETSLALERAIGGAIWTALRDRDGKAPRVDLASPDVTVAAEVLGPRTLLCLRRRAWRAA